ncbi:MAG: HAMP domain-containing histidine kinase [Rubrivivax sp.]|nr:HAMP domain-containing histidine kinase [Rubrivivax sp.]
MKPHAAARDRWRARSGVQAWRRWRHSLRWRLVTVFLLLALVSTGIFFLGTQQVVRAGWEGYARPMLGDYLDRLTQDLGSPPDAARARALAQRLPLHIRVQGPVVQFDTRAEGSDRGDDDERGSAQAGYRHGRDPWSPEGAARDWGLERRTADGHRVIFSPGLPAEGQRPRFFGWLSLAALLLLTGAAYAAVHKLLSPLRTLGAGVQRYGQGEFAQAIPVLRNDELGDLAQRINAMAASLHGMLEAKRTLLLAISHELRSPLTRARLNAELIDDSPQREALLADLAQMRDLITDLLESERLSQGHAALQREALPLEAWLSEQVRAIGGAPAVRLRLALDLGTLHADPARLRLLLRNLIHNAQRHGRSAEGLPPELHAERVDEDGQAFIVLGVRDHGPGVAPEQLRQLAEPFYRTDAARQRQTGGVGLGLHLCRQVAQAHGGRLELRLAHPGLEVSAYLPTAPVKAHLRTTPPPR